ncbi:MAG: thiamine pyrophosphate-binding protein [Hyphomicrobiales bacterium]|jgi:acetolactate synthase I/II/III large subunit|nr:thiamine pyrophosphate-binding protein [Hyphomicrobiales bacterium]|tara:strand:+ start:1422 stop:3089 length:1668 start_codon:yes stop_codon:yes gene_type:complete
MPKMSGGRFIAKFLEKTGTNAVFFVPTILSRPLAEMDNMPIKRVLAHAEKSAAYMADGYARASGKPGICAGQAVGAANLAAGLRDALLGNSPVISISGGRKSMEKHKGAYQENDDFPVFEALTKANFQVDQVERLPDLMRQAFREATSGNPGPVNLQLAGNNGQIEDDYADLDVIVENRYTIAPSHRILPPVEDIKDAIAHIKTSKKPLIILGGGARISGAGDEAIEFSRKFGIPIATSVAAYNLVPEDYEHYIGVPGSYSRSCSNKIVSEADLVIYIGSSTGGQVTHFWKIPDKNVRVIQIGIDPSDLGRNYPNDVSLLGDAKSTLQLLLKEEILPLSIDQWLKRTKDLVKEWRNEVEKQRNSNNIPIRPERMMKEISESLPDDSIVVSDTGHTAMWTVQNLWINKKWEFIRCAGSLGWGFPAAMGAKCAFPEKNVFCLTGDGGLWYHFTELETAIRSDIPTITIVNNNNALNQEYDIFMNAYDGKPSNRWTEMWYFNKVSFAELANNMGAFGIKVTDPNDIKEAIHQAIKSKKPSIIEIEGDINALAPTAWTK